MPELVHYDERDDDKNEYQDIHFGLLRDLGFLFLEGLCERIVTRVDKLLHFGFEGASLHLSPYRQLSLRHRAPSLRRCDAREGSLLPVPSCRPQSY